MKKILFSILLLFCLVLPASAGTYELEDVSGNKEIKIYNYNPDDDFIDADFLTTYQVSGENTFRTHQDDFLSALYLEFEYDPDGGNQSIPFSLTTNYGKKQCYVNITRNLIYTDISFYCDNELIVTRQFSQYFTKDYFVVINENYVVIHNGLAIGHSLWQDLVTARLNTSIGNTPLEPLVNWWTGVWGVEANYTESMEVLPSKGITINLDDTDYITDANLWIDILDDSRYDTVPEFSEAPAQNLFMRIYKMVTVFIPDPGNLIYTFFLASSKLTDLVLLMFSVIFVTPFFYIFIALTAALCSFVLNGSFRGGTAAGIKTFMWFVNLPYQCLKAMWHLLLKIIEVIYPF
ncbi:MAG: hypothetical protein QG646_2169 [Euryarchaeota archaeon]|nr:hypothetical protein [Euryarchaeota archaeon]